MDWELIKKHSAEFDALVKKEATIGNVSAEVNHMLAVVCYTDAAWIASLPGSERKEALTRVHEIFRDDVSAMAKMIIKGEIP